MSGVADKILNRVRGHGRGNRVYTPKDFLDLGSRAALDQALSRMCRAGTLRRVGRGLYDWPRHSAILDQPAPASVDSVVDAVKRRANVTVVPGNLAAANALGLTNAVPTRPDFLASRHIGDVVIGNRTVSFRTAGSALSPWLDTPAAVLVQALFWLHDNASDRLDDAVPTLRKRASDDAKRSLAKGINKLPGWAIPAAREIVENRAA
jgi:Family of unknown function (DUF6088)